MLAKTMNELGRPSAAFGIRDAVSGRGFVAIRGKITAGHISHVERNQDAEAKLLCGRHQDLSIRRLDRGRQNMGCATVDKEFFV